MFENISKGEFSSCVGQTKCGVNISTNTNKSKNFCIVDNTFDAEFIAYCFNLQQRYDINKLEEAVKLLERLFEQNMCSVSGDELIEQLLKQIKK